MSGEALAELVSLYLSDLRARSCPRHWLACRTHLQVLLQVLGALTVGELRLEAVLRHRAARVANGASNRTANLEVGALKAFLRWAVDAGLCESNAIQRLRMLPETPRYQRRIRRALSEDEIERLLEAALDEDLALHQARVPQFALWLMLLETGARWGELMLATWGDLDHEARALCLRASTTKSGRPRTVPLRAPVAEHLAELRAIQADVHGRPMVEGDRILQTPKGRPWPVCSTNALRALHRLLQAAEIPKRTEQGTVDVQALRHTYATRLVRAGVGLAVVQRLLGHASVQQTCAAYTHLGDSDLRAAIERLPPLRNGASRQA